MKISEFKDKLSEHNINLNNEQLEMFKKYSNFLREYNQKVNLTAITEEREIYSKHFYDSALVLFDKEFEGSLIDVGTGAGFPGVVLKILKPNLSVTLLEPIGKRAVFLNELTKLLELDIEVVSLRAEEYVKDKRETFDFVVSRAVANLPVLSELCLPLVKIGGYFCALKGKNVDQELVLAKKAIETLGGEYQEQFHHTYDDQTRYNLFIKKINKTNDKYPRNYGAIKKKPL